MLRRYLITLGVAVDRVDDLVQDVFVIALEKWPAVRGNSGKAGWMRGVARNLFLRACRSAALRREVELADEVWHEECFEGDGDELVAALRVCVRGLPQRSQRMLQRAYGQGDGRAVLAREFRVTANGVKTALRRLRSALKQCMERRLRSER